MLCADRSYYCVVASDLTARIRDHASGKGSGYTKELKPLAMVWFEPHPNRHSAAGREKQIKRSNREKKRRLAEGEREFEGCGTRIMVSLV